MIVTYSDHINDSNEYSSGFVFPHHFFPLVPSIALGYGDPDNIPVIEAVQVQYLRLTRLHGGYMTPSCSVNNAAGEEVEDSLDIGTEVAGKTPIFSGTPRPCRPFYFAGYGCLWSSDTTWHNHALINSPLAWTRIRTHSFGPRSDSGDHWNKWNLNQLLERFQNRASY